MMRRLCTVVAAALVGCAALCAQDRACCRVVDRELLACAESDVETLDAQAVRAALPETLRALTGGPGVPVHVIVFRDEDTDAGWHRDFLVYEALSGHFDGKRLYAKYAVDVYCGGGRVRCEIRSRMIYLGPEDRTPYRVDPFYNLLDAAPYTDKPARKFALSMDMDGTLAVNETVTARMEELCGELVRACGR